jgi:predicted transposase/invertase (TIGR01784 family)
VSRTPHDALFKAIFSQPPLVAEVLRGVLPPELARLIDFSSLAQEPGSFIDEKMARHCADLLFRARTFAVEISIHVLFEHQSTFDRTMPLRLLDYMSCVWRSCLTAAPGRPLPVVVPVVLHHSDSGWLAATTFESLFGPAVPAPLQPFVPRFRFVLLDLSSEPDDVLMARVHSATVRLTLAVLKHARGASDLAAFVPAWTQLVREVQDEPNGARALLLIFRYLAQVRGDRDAPVLQRIVITATKETDMRTIAEMWEQQAEQRGEQRGQLRGEQRLLLRQLRLRFGELPPATVERIEAAGEPLLERWAGQILSARTLEDVFA